MINSSISEEEFSVNNIEKMHDYISGRAYSAAIYVAAKLKIADYLSEKNSHYHDLAKSISVKPEPLYRLLRALASIGIFSEISQGIFSMTELANTLVSNNKNSMRDLAIMCGEPWHWDTWGGLLYTVQTGGPYFVKHFGVDFFPYIKDNIEVGKRFNNAMTSLSSLSDDAISKKIDFSKTKSLVDIGGGKGGLVAAILDRYQNINAVLFDLPETLEEMNEFISTRGLKGRCKAIGGDFFDKVPEGGDTYIVKHVMHGMNDDQAVNILNNIKNVSHTKTRILIVEMMIPDENEPSFSKFNDLGMMLLSETGKERTKKEFESILQHASLSWHKTTPIHMGLYVIEAHMND